MERMIKFAETRGDEIRRSERQRSEEWKAKEEQTAAFRERKVLMDTFANLTKDAQPNFMSFVAQVTPKPEWGSTPKLQLNHEVSKLIKQCTHTTFYNCY
jgi:hypothetical protein